MLKTGIKDFLFSRPFEKSLQIIGVKHKKPWEYNHGFLIKIKYNFIMWWKNDYWVNGSFGVGKTTIAIKLKELLDNSFVYIEI